jgi:hypothetical protein
MKKEPEKVAHVTMKFRALDKNVDALIKSIVEHMNDAPFTVIHDTTEIRFRPARGEDRETFGLNG